MVWTHEISVWQERVSLLSVVYGVALEDLWIVSPAYIFKAVEARYDIS